MLQKVAILKSFSAMNISCTCLEWKCNIEERWNPMSSCRKQCKAESGLIPDSNYQRQAIRPQSTRRFSINQKLCSNKRGILSRRAALAYDSPYQRQCHLCKVQNSQFNDQYYLIICNPLWFFIYVFIFSKMVYPSESFIAYLCFF